MNKIGIYVGEEGRALNKDDLRIDGTKKQFKYRKTVDIHKAFPAVPFNQRNSVNILYDYTVDADITYTPAFEIYLKGYNGRWGIGGQQSPQSYTPSFLKFPYFVDNQYIDSKYFNCKISINNLNIPDVPVFDFPAHEIIVRLLLFYDPLDEGL